MNILQDLIKTCRFLYERGLATSTSGNISARVDDKVYLTATGVSLIDVTEKNLAITDLEGNQLNDIKPTKEVNMHLAVFRNNPDARAIVHIHPVHAIAASCLLQVGELLPAFTPQFVMRAGYVPIVAYAPAGSDVLAASVANCNAKKALILQNHGAISFGKDFKSALGTMEELEENCKIFLLAGNNAKMLTDTEVKVLLNKKM